MGETSPQTSAKIDWGCAAVGSGSVWQCGSPGCSVSIVSFESALVRETGREAVKLDVDVVGVVSVWEAGTLSYVRPHDSLPLHFRLRGYEPIRLVRMAVNVLAKGPLLIVLGWWFENVPKLACSMLARVHSGFPSQYLSYDPGLHKWLGYVTGGTGPLTIGQGRC